MFEEHESLLRKQLRLSEDIKLAATELQLAEQMNVRQEETPAYTFVEFLSDAGGALGLILGLSIFQIYQWFWALFALTAGYWAIFIEKILHYKSVSMTSSE